MPYLKFLFLAVAQAFIEKTHADAAIMAVEQQKVTLQ